jgi:hypothetical protein
MTLIVFNVTVSVKIAEFPYSSYHYTVPSTIISKIMFQYLYLKIREDFRLEPDNYYISLYETNENPACEILENTTIRNQFSLKHNIKENILFYIIKKDIIEQEALREAYQERQCPICYLNDSSSNRILTTIYYCGHPICQLCHIQCINHNRRVCSLCRSSEIFHI